MMCCIRKHRSCRLNNCIRVVYYRGYVRTGANSGNNEAYIQSYLKQVTQAVYCSDMINENTHVSASMMDCDEKNYRYFYV